MIVLQILIVAIIVIVEFQIGKHKQRKFEEEIQKDEDYAYEKRLEYMYLMGYQTLQESDEASWKARSDRKNERLARERIDKAAKRKADKQQYSL